ncbi:cytochrome bd ubiquinol oxidase [Cavenderia fasciculata]|uniref:Cytochrome bd ubiquinol oxidase n=1 Tax=Cavenderia fasciculata TaxID=261658 RepID=F4QBJ3_CACFS|nr:cytochrome bd ubiquinol oxidase [Cavenderia fasciculata]EGG14965.1 cytochrome bd ubiquinol oxidase [Cavenderia fasciculata]|eukprot:XP_004351481.1 cytochrome bd ubiquinol oxidase [Cavenderia fasciculata]
MSRITQLLRNTFLEHQKIGLYYADLYNETPVVKEVLRRLPTATLAQRDRRHKIAFDLNVKKQYLEESQWSNSEKDLEYTTLFETMMNDVENEFEIRKAFRA